MVSRYILILGQGKWENQKVDFQSTPSPEKVFWKTGWKSFPERVKIFFEKFLDQKKEEGGLVSCNLAL